MTKMPRCASDQSSILPYWRSIQRKNFDSFELCVESFALSSLALSIGVSVKETSIETMIRRPSSNRTGRRSAAHTPS